METRRTQVNFVREVFAFPIRDVEVATIRGEEAIALHNSRF
jgi:hypothetical protein